MPHARSHLFAAAATLLLLSSRAHAYIDLAPTLGKIIRDSKSIALLEVTAFDRPSRALTLKPLTTFKGDPPPGQLRHILAQMDEPVRAEILRWAAPGSRAVLFATPSRALVCIGAAWYALKLNDDDAWQVADERPDLPLAYCGGLPRLADALPDILAGRSAVITTVAYGSGSEGAMFDIALNRQSLPGLIRLQRLRAALTMPAAALGAASDPHVFIGPGAVDESDLPDLLHQLANPDPAQRAQAADDLGSLGPPATSAADALAKALRDPDPAVRSAAAGALLRITPHDETPLTTLQSDLAGTHPATRRAAAAAAGFAGPRGTPLAPILAHLLSDPDEPTRLNALQSLSMLGPAAEPALPALLPLLKNPDLAIDAADAVGRIGPPAKDALPQLTQMLHADDRPLQWAACRAMAQIGGPDAHPAVDFILSLRTKATEVEGYNLMIYLALLGPVARDALPKLPSFPIRNRGLITATTWAIDPSKGYPWRPAPSAGFGFMGGAAVPHDSPGFGQGGGLGSDIFGSLMELIWISYIHNLGSRLAAVSPRLASDLLHDSAGDVPPWGFELLNADPHAALALLTPALASKDPTQRERAAVALGYMGPTAAPAKDALESAQKSAATDPEHRLLAWALRHVTNSLAW
ncbi:MAG TPA: HEAT repeat domain-containing protein [Phycisphaerae bacterium]|nr:HEAT repeat domain-containing protein [Phycisphaerae bacterium]